MRAAMAMPPATDLVLVAVVAAVVAAVVTAVVETAVVEAVAVAAVPTAAVAADPAIAATQWRRRGELTGPPNDACD